MSGPARRAKRVEGAGRRLGALAVAAALAVACGEGSPAGAPRPTSVTPAQGSQVIPVPVRIEGAFDAQVSSDFTGQGGVVDARFQAFLGDTALEDVALRQDGAIAATVPLGLAAGSHDLTVIGPDGRAGRLARAYQVLAYGATVAAVAGYRVEAVAAQVTSGPFTVVVTAIDAAGAVVPDFAGSVTLSDLTGTVVPREVGPFVAGRWTGTVEIRARHAADVLTVADAGGASGRSGPFPVGPAPVAAVRFDTPAAALTAGQCAGPLTLSIADAFGQPTTAGADTPLALAAAPSAGFALFDGAGCTTPIAAPAVAAGQGSVSLWIRATVAGPLALTAAAGAFPPAAQTWSVAAGPPATLAFVTAPLRVAAGACSGVATLEVRDAHGNPSSAGVAAVALAAAPSTGVQLFADACATPVTSLVVPAGATTAELRLRATAAGTVQVSASASGLAGASQDETVDPGPATSLVFVTAPQAVEAGSCSGPVTLEAQDACGNPSVVSTTAPVPVALAGSDLTFFAGAGCTGGAVSFAAGATTTTFSFRRTVAGTGPVDVTASAPGLTAGVQTERIVAGPPARLAFATPAQVLAAGDCSADVIVATQDTAGNTAAVPALTAVDLSGAGLTFHAGSGCAGAGVAQVSIPPGASSVTLSFAGTAAGAVNVTAAAAGIAPATQVETVEPGALDHLDWAPIASPQGTGVPFAVGLTARDAAGNLVPFTGTAALTASSGALTCTAGCTAGAVTAPFAAGQWSGSVAISPAAGGVTLTAAASGRTGTSSAFEVQDLGAAPRSPPSATFTATPRLVVSGNTVSFDAGASTDRQTSAAALEVSWDFEAVTAADYSAPAIPPATPWTAWTTTKTASHAFINNGAAPVVVRPRLAVRDDEAGTSGPDVGFAAGLVVVLPHGNDLCVVDTGSLVDDGANACSAPGPDGRLSLREAVRLANGWPGTLNITFSGPMTIAGASGASLTLTRAARIVGVPGVVLDGVALDLAADDVLVAGLELANLVTPLTVRDQIMSDVQLEDLVVRDGAGILVQGRARLRNVRMSGCAGACVRESGPGAFLAVFGSDFQGTGAAVGVAVDGCAAAGSGTASSSPYEPWTITGWSSTGSAFVASSVFTGFATGVSLPSAAACMNPVLRFVTFDRNGTGVRRDASSGFGGELTDALFTRQTASAVDLAACAFATVERVAAWGNASQGCTLPDVVADPLYVWPGARDLRLQHGSPLKDAGSAAGNVELDDAGPGLFLGAAPDRGGRETY